MKVKYRIALLAAALGLGSAAEAGNPDRQGQAGATQLIINGWSRSAGWGWANVSGVRGLESMYMNVAGLAYTPRTEVIYSRTAWLIGTDINVNNFGISQRLGKGALGISIMSYDIGAIPITTEDQPDGGIGTFTPQMQNLGLGYSRSWANISAGMLVRVISEGISDAKAQGISMDAGVQYTESAYSKGPKQNDIHFGVSLKNVGPDMTYRGDGLSRKVTDKITGRESIMQQRTENFNLPTLLNVGASYDFRLDKDSANYNHRLTAAANFTSNAFFADQTTIGLEYGYKKLFAVRAGYVYEDGIFKYETRRTALTGFSAGATVSIPLQKRTVEHSDVSTIDVDFAYRSSNPFSGCYSVGIRLNLGAAPSEVE